MAVVRRAAIFDVDRTLVRVNTGRLYVRWRYARREAGLRDVLRFSRWMAQYTLGTIDAAQVVGRALESLAGVEEERFRDECGAWYAAAVRPHISEAARAAVEAHRRRGDVLAILSASTPYVAQPLAADLDIEHVLCTRLTVESGRFTGGCDRLCYGDDKARIAEEWAATEGVDLSRSVFYTDSVSDLPMLLRVGEPRVVNPDPRLRLRAALEGWQVSRWR